MKEILNERVLELIDEYLEDSQCNQRKAYNYNDSYYHDRYSDRYDDRYDDYDDNRYHDAR